MIKFNMRAFYDTVLSNVYFDEFKNGVDGSSVDLYYGNRSLDYVVIFENEQVAKMPYFKKSKLARMKKEDLLELAEMFDFEDGTKAEIIADLLTVDNSHYFAVHFNYVDWCDLDYDFKVSGYSQGDLVKIKLVGSDRMQDIYSKEYLTNIFFDYPVTIAFEMIDENSENGSYKMLEDLYLCEYLSSVYRYDKEDLLNNFEKYHNGKHKKEILEYLKENLPKDLDYK